MLGLGYVGFPLAYELAQRFDVVGFDTSNQRIAELATGIDRTRSLGMERVQLPPRLSLTGDMARLSHCDVIMVCVPTPVDEHREPNLEHLLAATRAVGQLMKRGAIVVFESTVYPGVTEEICAPLLERESKLVWRRDFFVAFSPERINPGDREHTLSQVVKVVAADLPSTLDAVALIYGAIIPAGVHRAVSIRAAEAAKLVENIQRDVNIALMNELSCALRALGLDTRDVLQIAATKWNFLPFEAGLVGGHCVGVDPYYMRHAARATGAPTPLLDLARETNESMAVRWAEQLLELLATETSIPPRILILGLTFKENTRDVRNSKALEFVARLQKAGCRLTCFDPLLGCADLDPQWELELSSLEYPYERVDAVVFLVPHREIMERGVSWYLAGLEAGGVVFDPRGVCKREEILEGGYRLWRP